MDKQFIGILAIFIIAIVVVIVGTEYFGVNYITPTEFNENINTQQYDDGDYAYVKGEVIKKGSLPGGSWAIIRDIDDVGIMNVSRAVTQYTPSLPWQIGDLVSIKLLINIGTGSAHPISWSVID